MIPRLWQCAEPALWERALGLPLALSALLLYLGFYIIARAWQRHLLARVLLNLFRYALVANAAILGFGILTGVPLRLLGLNPSTAYELARVLWLAAGWPLVGFIIWRQKRTGEQGAGGQRAQVHWADRLFFSFLGTLIITLVPLLALFRAADAAVVRIPRSLIEYAADDWTTRFATDHCLAEHGLEYKASKHDSSEMDFGRLAGNSAGRELNTRHPHVERAVFVRAFRSYRQKVLGGDLPEPETLDGLGCTRCPEVQQELRDWASDSRHTPASREVATRKLDEILHPKPPPPPPDPNRFKLRYPPGAYDLPKASPQPSAGN